MSKSYTFSLTCSVEFDLEKELDSAAISKLEQDISPVLEFRILYLMQYAYRSCVLSDVRDIGPKFKKRKSFTFSIDSLPTTTASSSDKTSSTTANTSSDTSD